MTLALSTRWLGARPFAARDLITAMRDVELRACAVSAFSQPPPAGELGRELRGASAFAVAVEAVAGSGERVPASLVSAGADEAGKARATVEAAVAYARGCGAPVVIVHLGEMDGDHLRDGDREALGMLRSSAAADQLREIVGRVREEYERRLDPYLERACRVLFSLSRGAPEVRFAVATPRSIAALPTAETLEPILREVGSANLGYWHDTSAAWRLERLGVAALDSWIGENGGRVMGTSVSDATPADDHLPPGAGAVDLRRQLSMMPRSAPRVLDVDSRFPRDEVRMSIDLVRKM